MDHLTLLNNLLQIERISNLPSKVLAPATAGRCRTKRSTVNSFVISFSVISFSGKENIPSWECFQPQSLAYLKTEGGLWSINCSFVHWWEHVELTGTNAGIARWPSPICTQH